VGTRFFVNLVLCHVEAGKDRGSNAAEIARLADVYRYFESLTGNRGVTLLLSSGLGNLPEPASAPLVPQGDMVSLRSNLTAANTSQDQGQRIFASPALQSLIQESGFGASAPPFTYVTLGAGG